MAIPAPYTEPPLLLFDVYVPFSAVLLMVPPVTVSSPARISMAVPVEVIVPPEMVRFMLPAPQIASGLQFFRISPLLVSRLFFPLYSILPPVMVILAASACSPV